jgi:diaminopimelate decarboxylase
MPETRPGELLCVLTAGAYGAVQAGTYNTRPLVPEVLVEGNRHAVIRPRQSVADIIAMDRVPEWLG